MDFESSHTIFFDNYKILLESEYEEPEDFNIEEYLDSEWLLEEDPDIYSTNHPWDCTFDTLNYYKNHILIDVPGVPLQDSTLYIPSRFSRDKVFYDLNSVKLINTGDRYSPV